MIPNINTSSPPSINPMAPWLYTLLKPKVDWIAVMAHNVKSLFSKKKYESPHEISDDIRSLAQKHYGTRKIPTETEDPFKAAAIYQVDGINIKVTDKLEDNTQEIIDYTASALETIISGEEFTFTPTVKGKMTKVYQEANLLRGDSYEQFFCGLNELCLQNPDYLKLHDITHTIDSNPDGEKPKSKHLKLFSIPSLLPLIGPLFKIKSFNYRIEAEGKAFKWGADSYISDIIDKAADKLNTLDDETVCEIKDRMEDINSRYTKDVIKLGFLGVPHKGYELPRDNYSKVVIRSIIGSLFISQDNIISQGIGAIYLASAAHNAIKLPFSMYFSKKINRNVDTLTDVSKKSDIFYDTLVKNYNELKN